MFPEGRKEWKDDEIGITGRCEIGWARVREPDTGNCRLEYVKVTLGQVPSSSLAPLGEAPQVIWEFSHLKDIP